MLADLDELTRKKKLIKTVIWSFVYHGLIRVPKFGSIPILYFFFLGDSVLVLFVYFTFFLAFSYSVSVILRLLELIVST